MNHENLKDYLKKTLTKSSLESYLYKIEKFIKANKNADKYDYEKIMQYIELLRKTHQASTIKTTLASIKKYYDFLIETGQRQDNPTNGILLKDSQEKAIQLQDLLTEKELQSLLNPREERYAFLAKRNQIIMSLLINQALRVGEIQALKTSDLNLEKAEINIKATALTNQRILPIKAQQILLLYDYLQTHRNQLKTKRADQNALLLSKLGTPIKTDDIHYLVSTFKKDFKNKILTPTTIRQSVIANLLSKNNDLRVVQHFAGHKSLDTTEKYRQTGLSALKIAIEKLHPLK